MKRGYFPKFMLNANVYAESEMVGLHVRLRCCFLTFFSMKVIKTVFIQEHFYHICCHTGTNWSALIHFYFDYLLDSRSALDVKELCY